MQVSAYMHTTVAPVDRKRVAASSADRTRERILNAALYTFSTDGIRGATTRKIAQKARVNEVTLFRHFRSKEQLLGAVLKRGMCSEVEVLDAFFSWRENLRENMANYARYFYDHVEKKKGIARAFLAEGQILPKSMQTMIADVIRPVRERLINILTDAQSVGVVRSDLNIECALDAFKNALYAGMLRQGAYIPCNYSPEQYISTVADIFVRGIEASRERTVETTLCHSEQK
ncbi:MAG TPA: TetR/AcrR family transcriptional regulator [Chthoniobacterales bacterium]|jgi:AcrR family transcriptional regulator|nr:TetR/AcrR family transcriptional regulator [Chthoniobacterales bacterium]